MERKNKLRNILLILFILVGFFILYHLIGYKKGNAIEKDQRYAALLCRNFTTSNIAIRSALIEIIREYIKAKKLNVDIEDVVSFAASSNNLGYTANEHTKIKLTSELSPEDQGELLKKMELYLSYIKTRFSFFDKTLNCDFSYKMRYEKKFIIITLYSSYNSLYNRKR